MELSKSDKRIARTIIEKGLLNEFAKGLNKADKILDGWKQGKKDVRESYYALFKHISGFDKGIATRYDGMPNSDLVYIVIQQLNENLIGKQDLQAFSAEGQAFIQGLLNLRLM